MTTGRTVKSWSVTSGQKTYKLNISDVKKGPYLIRATIDTAARNGQRNLFITIEHEMDSANLSALNSPSLEQV